MGKEYIDADDLEKELDNILGSLPGLSGAFAQGRLKGS